MSELIIIGYPDHDTADRANAAVLQLQRDRIVNLTGLAVVRVDDDGKQHIDTPTRVVATSAVGGALWGMLIGLLFLVPAIGLLVGGAWGAVAGAAARAGINRGFREKVDGLLEPGLAAVVILTTKVTGDKFAAAMAPFGGTVLKTSLTDEDELALADGLSATE
ncbi:hypothetical protein BW730_01355 [Tessaracoccus aquimaris]|uniref:DUF1269 domain-containing protein n=1 Tax=Tessaracoccus aquimaris TaxID=1332264 RepID=A0A1Q2CJW8_9ACTN|nr:DUF1269 domain-containing protein [Tessaracoccus aquimaris]AQP46407.1 hypothetical protein BW730_01355 [Tessaracoccus aquimaris]